MARYFHTDIKTAKCMLTKLFYGDNPDADISFVWELKNEIDSAINDLLDADQQEFGNLFQNRRNPKYTKFAYIMAKLENYLLEAIIEKVRIETFLLPITLIYDGAIVEVKNDTDRERLVKCIENAEK